MNGDWSTLGTASGEPIHVYLAGAEDAPRGLLICHEWWGIQPHNLAWAEAFAERGWRVCVVDLYGGRSTRDQEEASALMRGVDQDAADRTLLAALEALKRPGRKLAALGVSFGGREALRAATLDPAVSATVAGYCSLETDAERLKRLGGPVLALYADQERSWPEKQQQFEAAMAAAGKTAEARVYPAQHGFMDTHSTKYDPDCAAQAWTAIHAFLDAQP